MQAASGRGKIKVGRSKDPEKRLKQLSTSNPEPLKLLATIEAPPKAEQLLHCVFNGDESHLEWHSLSPELEGILKATEMGIDLGPFLTSLVKIDSVKEAMNSLLNPPPPSPPPNQQRRRKKRGRKSKPRSPLAQPMKLTPAERKRRSEQIKRLHEEGKIGGYKYGKLGGRPRKSKPAKA